MKQLQSIREIRFNGKVPSIAYTDFSAIYLSLILIGDELETARIHELSHIWLQHQIRLQNFEESIGKVDRMIWNIAADLEIAKYIYSDSDNFQITKPRSLLSGAITTSHLKGFSGEYAEDFYQELLKNMKHSMVSFDASGNNFDKEQEEKQAANIPDIVKEAIEKSLQKKEANIQQKSKKQLHDAILDFKLPKPSLASEIDRAFGRNKIVRMSSYRRPSRHEGDFLLKGMISKKKAAKFTLYVDRSGSFNAHKTREATERLLRIVQKYRGKVEQDVLYFNDTLLLKDPINGTGGTNYQIVVADIMRNNAEINIVITDDDGCVDFDFKIKDKILVIPVGCASTNFARKTQSVEVL